MLSAMVDNVHGSSAGNDPAFFLFVCWCPTKKVVHSRHSKWMQFGINCHGFSFRWQVTPTVDILHEDYP